MQQEPVSSKKSIWSKQAPITIAGVVLLGIIGSTLYDLLVKPGLTKFGRFALDVLTLGSKRLLDSSYASASLDPNPVTGLLLLQGALLAASYPAFVMLGKWVAERERDKIEQRTKDLPEGDVNAAIERERDRLSKKVKRLTLSFWIMFLPWILMAVLAFSVHNQSVLVWRVFNANLVIISPKATPVEIAQFRAKFASMKSKSDYVTLSNTMSTLAKERGIELHTVETW